MNHLYKLILSENLKNFDDIKHYFSKEPYNLKIKENKELYLIKYDNNSNLNFEFVKKLRGIILTKDTNKMIFYGLNGKIDYSIFKNQFKIKNIIIEESIDGTLVNLFFYNNEWNISTKSCIDGAKSKFYSKKSFKELFLEVNFNFNLLNKNYCYSFVLQHPENIIVTKYTKSDIVLVNIRDMNTFKKILEYPVHFKRPKAYNFNSYEELETNLTKLDFSKEGYVLYNLDKTFRTKIKGNSYLIAKNIKGNNKNTKFSILSIIQDDYLNNTFEKGKQYLNYFPEYQNIFNYYNIMINKLINTLMYYYFITKIKKKFIKYPYHIKPPIYELHGLYFKCLTNYNLLKNKEQKEKPKITKIVIKNYLFKLPIERFYFILNRESQEVL